MVHPVFLINIFYDSSYLYINGCPGYPPDTLERLRNKKTVKLKIVALLGSRLVKMYGRKMGKIGKIWMGFKFS